MGKFTNLSKTLYNYFNNFLPAYIENAVPPETEFPYCTYTVSYDNNFEDNLIQLRIWTKSTSMVQVAEFSDLVEEDIGNGKRINCVDGGQLWLKAGTPFQQYISDDDITIKSVYINIIMNYLI